MCDITNVEFGIFRFTPVPTLIVDADRRIVQVSDSFIMTSPEENREAVLGQHADGVFERAECTPGFPALASARKAIRSAEDFRSPTQYDHQTDSQQVWRTRAVPIYRDGSLYCTQLEFQDVTDEYRRRLENEERLYAAETFRTLLETVMDYAIFMLDPKGNIATWNAGAQKHKGYTKEEAVGQHFSIFYGKDDLTVDKPDRELRDALRDGRYEDEGWRFRKDGSRYWANVVITPVIRDGTHLGFSKVTRDLTDRRNAEKRPSSDYEEASKLKSEFLANMSHEIHASIHGLISASNLLLDTQLDSDQLVLTRVIHESGRVLLQVIDDMLGYNKLTNRTFAISEDIINIADIVQSVERAQHNTFNHDVTFRTHLDPQIPKAGQGDSLRYRKVVQTLVSNAARITKKGYIHLNITLESEDQEYSTIRTEVVDTSFGVPAASTKALFTSFTQFDNSVTNRYPGLSICKVLAELMGGQIGFQANPEGQGSVFWFTIKLKKCRQSLTANTPATKFKSLQLHSPVVPDHKGEIQRIAIGKRLLLAENNAVDRIIMLRILATLGFSNIDVAFNGKEAVAKTVQTADDTHTSVPYDLILMGTNMPIQDGVSATQELRSRGFQMPILAKTVILLKSRLEEYIAKGMTDIIPHPMRGNELIKILLRYLQTSQDGSRTGS